MKKLIISIICAVLCLVAAACAFKAPAQTAAETPAQAVQTIEAQPAAAEAVQTAQPAEVQPAQEQQVQAAQTLAAPAAVQGPFGTMLTADSGKVAVYKSPTSESVPVGGACVYIARARNSTGIRWYVANWDASIVYDLRDAPYYFPGLTVAGLGTEQVTLMGVPYSMNGWRIQAGFDGQDGPVYSDIAYIYVYYPTVAACPPKPCRDHHRCKPCDDCGRCRKDDGNSESAEKVNVTDVAPGNAELSVLEETA